MSTYTVTNRNKTKEDKYLFHIVSGTIALGLSASLYFTCIKLTNNLSGINVYGRVPPSLLNAVEIKECLQYLQAAERKDYQHFAGLEIGALNWLTKSVYQKPEKKPEAMGVIYNANQGLARLKEGITFFIC